jgi:electron transfer flavoprotein beta subunit
MHIAVLLAGIADPRKPLPAPASGDWRDLRAEPAVSYKLSPFDEAALEIALKLRERHRQARITALVTDGAGDTALMRAVAALRPDRLIGLDIPVVQRGNPAWLARHAAELLGGGAALPDLILIGREHGDLDDGMVPPYLAEAWGLPYAGLALQAQNDENAGENGGGWTFVRSAAAHDESLRLPAPAMASVSNDKSNRLRHPLMKNVLLAKQQQFERFTPDAAQPAPRPFLARAAPIEATQRGTHPCRMLEGSAAEQARALAAYLMSSGPDAHASH